MYHHPPPIAPTGGNYQVPIFDRPSSTRSSDNPFDILGIPRTTTDRNVVENTYQQWIKILHPDRGGDAQKFQLVTAAYEAIKNTMRQNETQTFDALRSRAQMDIKAQASAISGGRQPTFKLDEFNSVFSDNQIWSPDQDGYGDQMVQSSYDTSLSVEEMARLRDQEHLSSSSSSSGRAPSFNASRFNDDFLKESRKRLEASSTEIVNRNQPDVISLFKTSISNSAPLSYQPIDDYSSPFASGGAVYSDYIRAFSEDALITPHVAQEEFEKRDINRYETEREQLSYEPSAELQKADAEAKARQQEEEENRWRSFLEYQEKVDEQYRRVTNLLSESK